jgi:hypothetical protein
LLFLLSVLCPGSAPRRRCSGDASDLEFHVAVQDDHKVVRGILESAAQVMQDALRVMVNPPVMSGNESRTIIPQRSHLLPAKTRAFFIVAGFTDAVRLV